MEQEIATFLERLRTPSNKMSVKELREREETWRALWSWIDEEIKYYIVRIGSTMRVIKRDYKGSLGELGSVKFKLDEIELTVYEKSYNYTDGKQYLEAKVIKIPSGAIMMQEFILESAPAEESEPEVMGLGNEVDALSLHNEGG